MLEVSLTEIPITFFKLFLNFKTFKLSLKHSKQKS
jgi:hypothetical protein